MGVSNCISAVFGSKGAPKTPHCVTLGTKASYKGKKITTQKLLTGEPLETLAHHEVLKDPLSPAQIAHPVVEAVPALLKAMREFVNTGSFPSESPSHPPVVP